MGSSREPAERCRHCGHVETVRNGRSKGRQRWRCRGCGRTFGVTTGTALAGLRTEATEVARSLRVVLRRGSLRGAEDVTGHKYETIGNWVRRAATHAEAVTAVLVHELHLTEVEVDEFWSFVRAKGRAKGGALPWPTTEGASAGGA